MALDPWEAKMEKSTHRHQELRGTDASFWLPADGDKKLPLGAPGRLIVKMFTITKVIYRVNAIPIKSQWHFLPKQNKKILKLTWNLRELQYPQQS